MGRPLGDKNHVDLAAAELVFTTEKNRLGLKLVNEVSDLRLALAHRNSSVSKLVRHVCQLQDILKDHGIIVPCYPLE